MSDGLINPFAVGAVPAKRDALVPGNIDLHNRPVVANPETGGQSTIWSMNFTDAQGREILVPRVVGGRILSPEEAMSHYERSGEHLGIFPDRTSAEAYGQSLHEDQAREYLPRR